MEVFLARHPPVLAIRQGLCYGQADVDVDEDLLEACLQNYLDRLPGRHDPLNGAGPGPAVFTSPLRRCVLAADHYAGQGNYRHDPRLLELSFGEWELRPWETLSGPALDKWMGAFDQESAPGGESFHDLQKRSLDWLSEVEASGAAQTVAFTHSGVLRAILCHVLGMPLRHAFQLELPFGAVVRLRHRPAPGSPSPWRWTV